MSLCRLHACGGAMHAVALRGQLLAPLSLGEVRILHAALSQRGCKALHSLPLIRRGGGCGKVWGCGMATCQKAPDWSCHITSSLLQAIFSSPSLLQLTRRCLSSLTAAIQCIHAVVGCNGWRRRRHHVTKNVWRGRDAKYRTEFR